MNRIQKINQYLILIICSFTIFFLITAIYDWYTANYVESIQQKRHRLHTEGTHSNQFSSGLHVIKIVPSDASYSSFILPVTTDKNAGYPEHAMKYKELIKPYKSTALLGRNLKNILIYDADKSATQSIFSKNSDIHIALYHTTSDKKWLFIVAKQQTDTVYGFYIYSMYDGTLELYTQITDNIEHIEKIPQRDELLIVTESKNKKNPSNYYFYNITLSQHREIAL